MKVPNSHRAKVSEEKILNYLLSEIHQRGRSKAKFFRKYGFNEMNISLFKKVLKKLLKTNSIADEISSPFGIKYIVNGEIKTPSDKTVKIQTVWIIEKGRSEPYLVTAYPA